MKNKNIFLEKYPENINWFWLCQNKKAYKLLNNNHNRIDWLMLSTYSDSMILLEKKQDKIVWNMLSANPYCWNLLEVVNRHSQNKIPHMHLICTQFSISP